MIQGGGEKGEREGRGERGRERGREGGRDGARQRERVGSLPPAAAKCIGRFPLPSAI